MAGMKQFRKFVRGVLDGIADETRDFVRQANVANKKGTAFHMESGARIGATGDVTVTSEGDYDIDIKPTITGAASGIVDIGGDIGIGLARTGSFIGAGNVELTVRVVVVNAQALAEGVDASNPDGLNDGGF